jgi:hypothetical protein
MKTSKLRKLAWAFFALALTTTSVSAQGYGYRNRVIQPSDGMPCIEQISDLTEKQKTDILALEQKHQEEMVALREDRRSTTDFDKKDSIREKMLEQKVDHRNAVKALLNPDQQRQYDLIQAKRGMGKYRNSAMTKGSGNRGNRNNSGWRSGNANANNCYALNNVRGQGRSGNRSTRCFRNQ